MPICPNQDIRHSCRHWCGPQQVDEEAIDGWHPAFMYRSFNAIYSKIGHCASEEVVVKLILSKCVPSLIYGFDACPVSITDKRTLDFVITRTLMRVFKTSSIDVVNECQLRFNFPRGSDAVIRNKRRFLFRFMSSDNIVCNLFSNAAKNELLMLR